MQVVLNASLGKAQLLKRLPELIASAPLWVDDDAAAIAALSSADVLVCPDRFISRAIADAIRDDAPKLRFVQLLTAGYDQIQAFGAPRHIAVCNAGQAYAPAVATHAVALLLAVQRCLPAVMAHQKRHLWDRAFTTQLAVPARSTVAIIGFGPIGREIARILRALGATIIAITRHGRSDPSADETAPVEHLHTVLPRADAIVIAAPYDRTTHRLIGAPEFARCKKQAVLVNIARGAIVDPQALDAALRAGTIAGAGLDVTDPEPLPSGDPLWDAPNVIITPHCAGASGPVGGDLLADLVCDNLGRFMRGEPLLHTVRL